MPNILILMSELYFPVRRLSAASQIMSDSAKGVQGTKSVVE